MPDIYVDVDTAVIVPVNIFPLTDDTDFKTIETAVVYNSAGMALTWNFVTSAGVVTQTAVTPTTAGVYDWSEPLADKGMYAIEIPASGGASINNDTEGYGWFTGVATGVLPWRSPIIGFRAAALNNALCDGGDVLDVSITEIGGVAQSATDLKHFADSGYDPATSKVQGVVLVDTTTTNTDMRGTNSAALASVCTETRLAELDAANIPADVAAVKTDTAAILLDTDVIGAAGAGLTAIPWNASWDAEVQSECADALTAYGASTHSAADVWAVATRVLTAGTNIVLAKGTGVTGFNDLAVADIFTGQMTEAYAADGTAPTLAQMQYMIWSALSQMAISGTTITCKKLDGTTTSMTFTVDSASNPTSRTRAT